MSLLAGAGPAGAETGVVWSLATAGGPGGTLENGRIGANDEEGGQLLPLLLLLLTGVVVGGRLAAVVAGGFDFSAGFDASFESGVSSSS